MNHLMFYFCFPLLLLPLNIVVVLSMQLSAKLQKLATRSQKASCCKNRSFLISETFSKLSLTFCRPEARYKSNCRVLAFTGSVVLMLTLFTGATAAVTMTTTPAVTGVHFTTGENSTALWTYSHILSQSLLCGLSVSKQQYYYHFWKSLCHVFCSFAPSQ